RNISNFGLTGMETMSKAFGQNLQAVIHDMENLTLLFEPVIKLKTFMNSERICSVGKFLSLKNRSKTMYLKRFELKTEDKHVPRTIREVPSFDFSLRAIYPFSDAHL